MKNSVINIGKEEKVMAEFHEVIKNFNKIRIYLRDFLVYGYKKRSQFQKKSRRTYDDEKRRICSYLGDYVKESYERKEKQISISLDTSTLLTNPLYCCYESKSFTANDIRLHFYLLDLLQGKEEMDLTELSNGLIDEYQIEIDTQLISRKLKEYCDMGIFFREKRRNKLVYSLTDDIFEEFRNDYGEEKEKDKEEHLSDRAQLELFLGYYSMEAPMALVGHYIQNSLHMKNNWFVFENYFIGWTLEDEVLVNVLEAIHKKTFLEVKSFADAKGKVSVYQVIPFFIMTSVQNGRRYIAVYHTKLYQYTALRIDYIEKVRVLEPCEGYEKKKEMALKIRNHIWGVSWSVKQENERHTLRFQICCEEQKQEIFYHQMKAESRRGHVRKIGKERIEFFMEVYDPIELMPWVRTFLGNICELECSDKRFLKIFQEDLQKMQELYEE